MTSIVPINGKEYFTYDMTIGIDYQRLSSSKKRIFWYRPSTKITIPDDSNPVLKIITRDGYFVYIDLTYFTNTLRIVNPFRELDLGALYTKLWKFERLISIRHKDTLTTEIAIMCLHLKNCKLKLNFISDDDVIHLKKDLLVGRTMSLEATAKGQVFLLTRAFLGRGSFRTFYLAVEIGSDHFQPYAYTAVPFKQNPILFTRESRIHSRITSPYIVKRQHSSFYQGKKGELKIGIMTEYCNSRTLFDFINRSRDWEDETLFNIVEGCLKALKYLNEKNVINCDIKPDNVFLHLNAKGNYEVKIGDFNLAQFVTDRPANQAGTIEYLSPSRLKAIITLKTLRHMKVNLEECMYIVPGELEKIIKEIEDNEKENTSTKNDIWSLGSVIYNMWRRKNCLYGPDFKKKEQKSKEKFVLSLQQSDIDKHFTENVYPSMGWLINNMLCIDSNKRPSAKDCLKMLANIKFHRTPFSY